MSFGETQAAVFVLQPVFSDGRGGLTVRGPPIDSVEGRRLAFSISWGGFTQQSFACEYFRLLAAALLFVCCRFYWLDFGIVVFSLSGGKKNAWESGEMNQDGHAVAGTAREPMLVDVFSHWKNLSLFHAVGVKYFVLIHVSQYPCFHRAQAWSNAVNDGNKPARFCCSRRQMLFLERQGVVKSRLVLIPTVTFVSTGRSNCPRNYVPRQQSHINRSTVAVTGRHVRFTLSGLQDQHVSV